MKTRFSIGLALGVIILPGLVLFTANPAKAQRRNPHSYCHNRARDYARRNARGGTFKGAGRGAAVGAIIGAISGNAGRGAAIGAGLGAVGGTVRKQESRDKLYQREYRRCMRRNRNR
ncbi:MAG: glycine zipper family protein [Xenococcaceae cyanobacterium MO_167.B27]|nr:glycine zipper family protein [Xenococcaceae cyanobacterium MO_167.B27]